MREIIARIVDGSQWEEYRAEYGETLLCGYARIGGWAVGIVANQKKNVQTTAPGTGQKRIEFGGVIYTESAEKAARFILDCNQNRVPLVFLHDVNGFMVGKEAEWSGIIRAGAKMVNAVSNSVVPKIAVICGGSFGAGHYAMCGKAYDPRFIFAWPTARYAVMSSSARARSSPRKKKRTSWIRSAPPTSTRLTRAMPPRGFGWTASLILRTRAMRSSGPSKPRP